MKSISVSNNILMLLFFLLLFVTDSMRGFAQGTCPITMLTVAGIKGKVVSQGINEVPVVGTKVELFRLNDDVLVESVLTDKEGFFKIKNVKNGKYRLLVWFTIKGETYLKYNVILRVAKSEKENNQVVYIRLGIDCFDSDAKLINEKT